MNKKNSYSDLKKYRNSATSSIGQTTNEKVGKVARKGDRVWAFGFFEDVYHLFRFPKKGVGGRS